MNNTKENKELNIYQKMDLVRVKVGIVNKSINMQIGNSGYKAVSASDILKAVNEGEHEVGLISHEEKIDILESEKLERIDSRGYRTIQFRVRVLVTLKVVNCDNPSEFVCFTGLGDGIDSMDKAVGKATTYAVKYALLNGYKIPTGEDPDYFKSEEIREPMATENDINEYVKLLGGEKFIAGACKKLGVKSLNDLTQLQIRERIQARKAKIEEQKALDDLKNEFGEE